MPALRLKTYQTQALHSMQRFLAAADSGGSLAAAWAQEMRRQQPDEAKATPPHRSQPFGDTPCLCLRIPTGGGKTPLAAHAIALIAREWRQADFPVALWLVPSTTIRDQTILALQRPGHPYRDALEAVYGQALAVLDLDAAASIAAQDLGRKAIVLVATMQSFRVRQTPGRNAYAFSGDFDAHFAHFKSRGALTGPAAVALEKVGQADLAEAGQGFLTPADMGRVKHSLANLLALVRPVVVVVDEAHNAKTDTTFETLKRLSPCAILELTATPVPGKTNVLYSVSARELQAEAMVKLPVMLAEHPAWQDAVRDAVLRRRHLEAEAAHEDRPIRPIVLFQAQDNSGEVTPDVLRQHLLDKKFATEPEIVIATGDQRGLDGVDLFDPACAVRFVITVEALQEGWDCSFAYVLCSLQNVRSGKDVEQLLGRVLRMPYATRRKSPALNRAYAHVVARSFSEAANALVDRMVQGMGFAALNAATAVLPDPGVPDLFGDALPPPAPAPVLTLTLSAQAAAALQGEPDMLIDMGESAAEGAPASPTLRLTEEVSDALLGRVLHLFERNTLYEIVAFDLLRANPRPELPGFRLVEQSDLFEIYVNQTRLELRQAQDVGQLSLDAVPTGAGETALAHWLARALRRPPSTDEALRRWVATLVGQLRQVQGLSLTGLLRARHAVVQSAMRRLDDLQARARKRGFEQLTLLDAPAADTDRWLTGISPDWQFHYQPGRYPARHVHAGRWCFRKHDFEDIHALKEQGEEFECAEALDALPEVKHWVRNIEQQERFSFWLPTATDYFYPDFVAELNDGRLFVVEYKGEAYATNDDSREKRAVGQAWARASGGLGVFLMAEKSLQGNDVASQMRVVIQGAP